ncbi:hypothetical protein [Streptomyces sp. NPDC048442]|uniref:hypothetical protein n=1 Tax=Streptomyces sp. NPDC048442 TaxID=3154823 RepID=UPI003426E4B5
MLRLTSGLRVAAIGVAGVLACTTLSGCGSDAGSKDDHTADKSPAAGAAKTPGAEGDDGAVAVRNVNQKTTEAKTARMVIRTRTSADGKSVAVDGEGAIDLVGGNSTMNLSAEGEKMEQRIVDQVLYQKLPPKQRSGVPGNKPWVKIDLKKAAQQQGGNAQAANPADNTAYLKGINDKDVKKLGEEQVGGDDTTRYRVTVEVAKLANGEQLKKQIGPTMPMDIWLDEDGRLRRQQVDMTLSAPQGTGAGSSTPKKVKVRTVFELSDFGTKVDAKAPPAAETADMTGKTGQGANTKA